MGKSMSYVTCQVTMMTGFYMHMVMNKFTSSPDPAPCWRAYFSWGNFDIMSRCLPLSGGHCHAQRTWPG